jgi:two-component system cell cycle response regulator
MQPCLPPTTMDAVVQVATRILIAEDSPICCKLLEHALAGQPYELCFATNGKEALEQYSKFRPDILVTDWVMPNVSGLEVCRQIRKSESTYTYIVLVTKNAERTHLIEGLDAGADDYLTKPFDAGELLARIRVGCRIVRMSREIEAKNALLEKAARTDHLTGLPNRLAVEEFAFKQLHAAIRHRFNLWVVVTDLDKLKLVNDTYGHFAGDAAIQRFATILKANTRVSDICGRLGGDEFLLIMSHGEKKAIVQTIERLRADLINEHLVFNGQQIQVTASFGIAGFDGTGEPNLHELLVRADHALYAAKADGRNQVRSGVRPPVLQGHSDNP